MGVPFRLALTKALDMKPHKRLRRPVIPCFDILILKFTFQRLLVPRNDLSVTLLRNVVAVFFWFIVHHRSTAVDRLGLDGHCWFALLLWLCCCARGAWCFRGAGGRPILSIVAYQHLSPNLYGLCCKNDSTVLWYSSL